MPAPTVEYVAPKTIAEACKAAKKHPGQSKFIAGGTDLLLRIKRKQMLPRYIINIKGITGYDYITQDKTGLKIGGLTTINAVATSSVIKDKFSVLAQAAGHLGSSQVRKMATIAGNLCNAAPSAETAPALVVLGASLKLVGSAGERTVPISEFFAGPGKTVLAPDEILVEIQVPNMPANSAGVYLRQTIRRAMDLAIVGVAAVVTMDKDIVKDVKIALGAVSPTPVRAPLAEDMFKGKRLTNDLIEKAGHSARGECNPITDVRACADYRHDMVRVLAARAVRQAAALVKKAS